MYSCSDEANVYVHDNSKTEVQAILIAELELAWAEDYIGISKKNTYFGIDMKSPETVVADGQEISRFNETLPHTYTP